MRYTCNYLKISRSVTKRAGDSGKLQMLQKLMSGGKLRGESFCIAGYFSNRLVFLLKFLLGESWPSSVMETTEEEDTQFPRGIVLSL